MVVQTFQNTGKFNNDLECCYVLICITDGEVLHRCIYQQHTAINLQVSNYISLYNSCKNDMVKPCIIIRFIIPTLNLTTTSKEQRKTNASQNF